jgi:putative membrane-bound dehydrogenase-like protein
MEAAMFRLAVGLLIALPALAAAQTHQVKLNGHTFTLPDGFTIEVAAGADLVPRPIVCDFDEKGRLYVCDSSGSNEKVAVQVEKKPHRIVRLESTRGDGKFDKETVFVKNVMFPEGAMWRNGSLYVAAPPHIWKFTDTDDDGVADKEEIWFDGKTLTGCANDLHGPYRGPDGWIYWTKGAFAKQEYTINGKKFSTRAAHIFRARPDGTGIEPVMTGGMDNPVDLVFTPGGDIIFSTTFFQHPRDGKRDGLIHAVYGAVYGKDHDPVYEHPWTHPTLMPPMTHMGPAAPCGLHRYESDQFGKDYENNLFCCQFNMRKVSRHVLVPTGSTYTTKDSDFVVSDNLDFHPTDVIEDADGSLLIVDTGGWYKLCCPTSQLVKPDVTGAIYRVKRVGAHQVLDPRGQKIDLAELNEAALGKLLHDSRPVVQRRAIDHVLYTERVIVPYEVAVMALTAGKTERGILNAIKILAQDPHELRGALLGALSLDTREEVRTAALHVMALNGVETWNDIPRRHLTDNSLRVRRVAAMALSRLKAVDRFHHPTVQHLIKALADETNDRALDHALTYALIEIGDAKETAKGLAHESPRVRRAVLAALSNIPGSGIEAKAVLAELDSPDPALRETAWWIAGRHPQWGDQLAGYFRDKLTSIDNLKPGEHDELAARLVKFAGNEAVQKVIGEIAARYYHMGTDPLLLRVMARSGVKAFPQAWSAGVTNALLSADEAVTREAFAVLRTLPVKPAQFAETAGMALKIKERGYGKPWSDQLLLAHAASAPAGALPLSEFEFARALKKLDRNEDGADRSIAADALARSKLTADQLIAAAGALKTANPLDLPKLLAIFEKSKDETVGLALVKALRDPALRSTVRAEMVKPILDKYPKTVQAEAEKLYAELAEARAGETKKLEKMIAELKTGDVRRGQLVFNNAKAQCIACHKVGYVGGTNGPDLTRIGGIRTERDLLEAIVFPSASFVRSYEPVRVVTTDERTFNGVLKKDAPDEIIVVIAADKEERISRADVASITPSAVSLMPSGLDQQLTPQDLADLVAFLRACK